MGKVLLVLILPIGLALLAAWNYQRNAPLDAELANRPYASLRDADLAALTKAHEDELARHKGRLGRVAEPSGSIGAHAPSDLGGKVAGFERAQRTNQRWNDVRRAAMDQEIALEGLRREQSIRARGLHRPWTRILRRITTL